jgi:Methyltransferase domain
MDENLSDVGSACRLCGSPRCSELHRDKVRPYLQCEFCGLIFVPEGFHVSPAEEKLRYAKHTNYASDRKYVDYLSDIAADILVLPVRSPRILDFGSGPEHVLSDILNGRGAVCVPHDPLYGLDASGSGEKFDIVVLCETMEHIRGLPAEFDLISRLVKPDGYVFVRTQLYDAVPDLRSWWYLVDVTHVNFFCVRTMEKVGELIGKRILSTNVKDTVVFA